MAQRQFRSDDTDKWLYGFGSGSDGDISINTSTDNPIDSTCSGTIGTTSLTATNSLFAPGQIILIHQTRGTGAGNWELNRIASYTAGTITLLHPLQNTYTTSGASVAQVLVMKQYNNFTINSGQTLTAKAWNGSTGGIVAILAKGTVTINGSILLNGGNGTSAVGGGRGIGGGFRGGQTKNSTPSGVGGQSYSGEGTANDQQASTFANGSGGGGALAANSGFSWAAGGGGGNGTNGNPGTNPRNGAIVGAAGNASGNAELTIMNFGGGGGAGACDGSGASGGGGAGGGILLIIASSINLTNATLINANGGNGGAGLGDLGFGSGGGGGAGGSVLLKGKTILLGTNKITAIGGSGGNQGGNGGVGRIHIDYKFYYSGSTNPTLDARQDLTLDWVKGGAFLYHFI